MVVKIKPCDMSSAKRYFEGQPAPEKRLAFVGLPPEFEDNVLLREHHPALDAALDYIYDEGVRLDEIWENKEAGQGEAQRLWDNAEKVAINFLAASGVDTASVKLTLI